MNLSLKSKLGKHPFAIIVISLVFVLYLVAVATFELLRGNIDPIMVLIVIVIGLFLMALWSGWNY